MSLESLLEHLKKSRKNRDFTAWEHVFPRDSVMEDFPVDLDEELRKVLKDRGIGKLYSHQSESYHLVRKGMNPVIATPTASGKTLCYNLPVINCLLKNKSSRALYLFPTKALARDQLHELDSMSKALDGRISSAAYDGDTPSSSRSQIRRSARILLTNPDMLHAGILPHHTKWNDFFQNLELLIIDELHHYRGVFGSHFCNVLRRLKRICNFYGSNPGFILCSATLANPEDLATGMIGAPAKLVSQSGAPSGEKNFLFFNPPLIDPASGLRRSYVAETIEFAKKSIQHDVQTIVFTRSRRNVEIIVRELKRILDDPDEGGIIRGYRGGYLPVERRAIESELREGKVRCVVATSALELGIDIGDLEMVILSGYPGTIASTWQRAGRSAAGKRCPQQCSLHPQHL